MKKAILPSKTYLVCSSGMMKTDMVVFSQATVKADKKNRLVATVDDRFGDFICKYALIVAALVAGACVATGGAVAGMIAAAAIALGTAISLSMCAIVNMMNKGGWQNYHPTVRVENKKVLTDKSYFSCPIGGTIIPIYDKNIANQQAAVFRNKAITEIAMSFVSGYLLGTYRAFCIANQVGFGGFMTGIGVGIGVNKVVSEIQKNVENAFIDPYTRSQRNSPLYNEEIHRKSDSDKAELPVENEGAGTVAGADNIRRNKEGIIEKGTADAQKERVNPNQEGTLNNPLNKNKYDRQEKDIKQRHGKKNYRRSEEWKALQREKAANNRMLGERAYTREQLKNIKTGAKGVWDGFNYKTKPGQIFWGSTLLETMSNIIVATEQRRVLDAAIIPEANAKAKIGIYAARA